MKNDSQCPTKAKKDLLGGTCVRVCVCCLLPSNNKRQGQVPKRQRENTKERKKRSTVCAPLWVHLFISLQKRTGGQFYGSFTGINISLEEEEEERKNPLSFVFIFYCFFSDFFFLGGVKIIFWTRSTGKKETNKETNKTMAKYAYAPVTVSQLVNHHLSSVFLSFWSWLWMKWNENETKTKGRILYTHPNTVITVFFPSRFFPILI